MQATIQSDVVKHYPVLLNELISIITPQYGGTFIDCTFGQGGYTKKILSYQNTQVIALDRDLESKKKADKISKEFQDRFIFKNKKFSQLDDLKLKNIRVNQSGCLDKCESGPVMVIYPEGIWYNYKNKLDIDEIIDTHLIRGKVVKRLIV